MAVARAWAELERGTAAAVLQAGFGSVCRLATLDDLGPGELVNLLHEFGVSKVDQEAVVKFEKLVAAAARARCPTWALYDEHDEEKADAQPQHRKAESRRPVRAPSILGHDFRPSL